MNCKRNCATSETCWKNCKDGRRVKLSLTVDMDPEEFHKMMDIIEDVSDELLDKLSERLIDGEADDDDEDMDESEHGVHVESDHSEDKILISHDSCPGDSLENEGSWAVIKTRGLVTVNNCAEDEWCKCEQYRCNLTKKIRFVRADNEE